LQKRRLKRRQKQRRDIISLYRLLEIGSKTSIRLVELLLVARKRSDSNRSRNSYIVKLELGIALFYQSF
jgi:hypothetical protein